MKKVLIALDYDPTAQKVAKVGYMMAKAMNAGIILLHVIADATYYSALEYSPLTGFDGYMDMSKTQFNSVDDLKGASLKYLEKVKLQLGDKTIQTMAKEGDSSKTILATAEELHIDVIVMGSHSRRWLDGILMGSVTEKVLHHTMIPLFIIPTKQKK